MPRTKVVLALVCLTGLGGIWGCSSESKGTGDSSGDALRSTQIPKDFTFATSRPVALHLEVKASAIQAVAGVGGLQVRLSDGTEIYRGPISTERAFDLSLMVPLKDSQLQTVLFTGKGQKKEASLEIVDGKASKVFE